MRTETLEGYRLSPQQRRLWRQRQACGGDAYRVLGAARVEGPLDGARLRAALGRVLAAHEILRTNFRVMPGMTLPLQVVSEEAEALVSEHEPRGADEAAREAEAAELFERLKAAPLDPADAAACRLHLLTLSPERHALLLLLPAMCADAATLRNLFGLLASELNGEPAAGPDGAIQYSDVSEVFNELLEGEETKAGGEYWRKKLAPASGGPTLPAAKRAAAGAGFEPRVLTREFTAEESAAVEALAARNAVALADVLQAGLHVLLGRHTGEQDVPVAAAFEGRAYEGLAEALGLFNRYLPVRVRVEEGAPFAELLSETAAARREAEEWQDYFGAEAAEGARPDEGRRLLYGFDYAEQPAPFGGGRVRLTVGRTYVCLERFDLRLSCARTPDGRLRAEWHYDAHLYERAAVEVLASQFAALLACASGAESLPAGELTLLCDAERRTLLEAFNDTSVVYEDGRLVHELFERQAALTPRAVAVADEAGELTYEELNARANQLARRLRALGVGPESLAGVLLHRSNELVVALLAVLKAGAAYVPLDPEYPADRLAFMLADAGAEVLLTDGGAADLTAGTKARVLNLAAEREAVARERRDNLGRTATAEGLAYVLYTSGSTGRPKGVMIPHGALLNHMRWMNAAFPLGPGDCVLQKTPFSFDASVWEFYAPLLQGARLLMARPGGQRDPAYLARVIREQQVTTLQLVPTLLQLLLAEPGFAQCRSLKTVFCGGEPLTVRLQDETLSLLDAVLCNLYGPTECTIDSTFWCCEREDRRRAVPIGRPVSNMRLYVLDRHMRPVATGLPGEIYLGGAGLGRGYLGRAALTAERFVPDPFSAEPGARLYKTGDLGRWLPEGLVEYLGRTDRQVKFRGHRIELEEIEAALAQHPAVGGSVVTIYENGGPEQRLAAYLIPRGASAPAAHELQSFLKERLPEYMLPSAFVALERWPLMPNGKIDRRALPAPAAEAAETRQAYFAPRGATEEALSAVWSRVLGVERVGAQDNFFALGGDSIRSIQVVAQAKADGLNFSVQDIFRHQTVAALAAALEAGGESQDAPAPVEPFALVPEEDRARLPEGIVDAYPLSMLQLGMIYHMELSPEHPAYQNVNSWRLRAPFEPELFREAVARVVARHPMLRTSFDLTSYSEPLQLVHAGATLPVEVEDLRHLPEAEQDALIEAYKESELSHLFDVSRPPLMRFRVHRRTDDSFHFTLTEHHSIFDGWSTTSTLSEIFTRYLALRAGEPAPEETAHAFAYRDYIRLERAALASRESREFWDAKLRESSAVSLPRWPERLRRGAWPRYRRLTMPIPPALVEEAAGLAKSLGVSIKSLFLTAHLKALSTVTGQQDFITGLVTNGRPEVSGGEQLRGLFLNTVPFRCRRAGGTWAEFARATFAAEAELLPHRRYPMAALQRERGRESLFETAFNYLHFHSLEQVLSQPGVQVLSSARSDLSRTHYTLMTTFTTSPASVNHVSIVLEYDAGELCDEQVEALGRYQIQALSAMVAEPHRPHLSHSVIPDDERRRLLALSEGDRGLRPPPAPTLHEWFALQAAATPDAVAVVDGARRLTYAELDASAEGLARRLRRLGVGPESVVAVCLERSAELVVSLLAALKAGGAYLPLDPEYPSERLAFMLEDSGARVLLTQAALAGRVPAAGVEVLEVGAGLGEAGGAGPGASTPAGAGRAAGADNLAYVIYTSGSTGRPKGTLTSHRAICNRLQWMQAEYGLTADDRVLQKTPYSFDVSVWEFFWPLLTGARLVVARPGGHQEPAYLRELIEAEQVTTLHFVPSMLALFLEEPGLSRCESVRRVMCSGEALSPELVGRFYETMRGRLHNLYGPTEAAVDVSSWECEPDARVVPIGRPIANIQLYVLDGRLQLAPAGVAGDLYIAGVGLARGYLNRPALTAEKFIPDPYAAEAGARMYRTGDLARYLPDGNLEYLGRVDHQVKVRGFRIELGEIESALRGHRGVRDAAVLAREGEGGDKRLVAYYVAAADAGEALTPAGLREHLRGLLPDYMVPSAFVRMDALPLTTNGKLDRKALPAPEQTQVAGSEYVAPRTPAEEVLCGVWEHLLGVERVGVTDNFFELGGHSLLAMQLLSRVRTLFAAELPLRALFEAPTVAGLARVLSEASAEAGRKSHVPPLVPAPRGGELPLSFGQQRMWLIYQLDPGNPVYNMHSSVRLQGPLDRKALERALNGVVRRHETLRTTFPALTDGRLRQVVNPPARLTLPLIDLSGLSAEERPAAAWRVGRAEMKHPFDLVKGPPMRAALVRLSEQDHVVLFTVHHIVSDGWSMGVLTRELSALYRAYLSKEEPRLPALPVQYADYAVWQRGWLQGEELEAQLDYWRRQLAELPPLNLPTDYPRPAVQTFEGRAQHFDLRAEVARSLERLSRQEGATLFMTGFAAFVTLLHRYTGQDDIAVGTPVTNRGRAETENLIGFFVNTLVLRADLAGNPTFRELLRRVRETALGAYEHQEMPFDLLVEHLRPERRGDYTPFFQVCYEMKNALARESGAPGLPPTGGEDNHQGTAHFDLTLSLRATPESLGGYLEYSTALFEPDTAAEIVRRYAALLESVAADPEQRLLDIPLGAEEAAGRYAPAFDPAGHAEDQFIFN